MNISNGTEEQVYNILYFILHLGEKIYPPNPLIGWSALFIFLYSIIIIKKKIDHEKEKRKEIRRQEYD